jgi:hypothetical protein
MCVKSERVTTPALYGRCEQGGGRTRAVQSRESMKASSKFDRDISLEEYMHIHVVGYRQALARPVRIATSPPPSISSTLDDGDL